MKSTETTIVVLLVAVVALVFANTFFMGDATVLGNYDSSLNSKNAFKDSSSSTSGFCSQGAFTKSGTNAPVCCPVEEPKEDGCEDGLFWVDYEMKNGCNVVVSRKCDFDNCGAYAKPADYCVDRDQDGEEIAMTFEYIENDAYDCKWEYVPRHCSDDEECTLTYGISSCD